MTNDEAINTLKNAAWLGWSEQAEKVSEAVQMAVEALKREASGDAISRYNAIDALMEILDRPNHAEFLYTDEICKVLNELPSVQPQRTCVNCGRTANNGGWYADGRTRCPIEEHYALPKDGYCHLWEKRNVTDDDYPERREE